MHVFCDENGLPGALKGRRIIAARHTNSPPDESSVRARCASSTGRKDKMRAGESITPPLDCHRCHRANIEQKLVPTLLLENN